MKLRYRKSAKIIAAVLFAVMLLLAAASAFGILALGEFGAYRDGGIRMREEAAQGVFYMKDGLYYEFAERLLAGDMTDVQRRSYEKQLSEESTNLSITITDKTSGEVLYQNFPVPAGYQYVFESCSRMWINLGGRTDSTVIYADTTAVDEAGTVEGEVCEVAITAHLKTDMTARDMFHRVLQLVDALIAMRYALFWILGIALLAALACFVFLLCAAGHDGGTEGIRLRYIDRIPLDLLLAAYIFAGAFVIALGDTINYGSDAAVMAYLLIAAACLITLVTTLLLTMAVRIKAGTFFGNTLIRRVLSLLWRGLCLIGHTIMKLPLWWQAGVGFIALSLIELIFLAAEYDMAIIGWLISRPLYLAAIIAFTLMLRRLEAGGRELAAGNTAYRVNTKWMPPAFARHAEALGSKSEGLANAVEARMRSERMKSELITNVSHDIKTPLTSIINYIDLLKTAGLDSPDAPQYLSVLEHQSARLRKLTEDLIEASKAATGTLAMHPEPTDVNVLLAQASGEYEEQLTAAGIIPTLRLTEENPVIFADGRLLWRVFDNLFSNIRKYAMQNTRAYFTSAVEGGRAVITFRNISAEELTMDGEELAERFVRGDASRHTEGSGLGLSIARSLTELMGGSFAVTVDGDLFKVTITFGLHVG